MALVESGMELTKLLDEWQTNLGSALDPVPTLQRIAEIIEKETEAYLKMDPDPFDDRHPSRARPTCSLGIILKTLFKNDDFMNKLVTSYVMSRDNFELQSVACRLMLDLLPGLETSVVFNDTEGLVEKLFLVAEKAKEPLKSYAIGLLAAAMEVADISVSFKENNMQLVPNLLKRLKELNIIQKKEQEDNPEAYPRPFGQFKRNRSPDPVSKFANSPEKVTPQASPVLKRRRLSSPVASLGLASPLPHTESNSSWADLEPYMIGTVQMHPLTTEMQQRFILQYLTPMGDYQEMLVYIFEEDALGLIMHYINLNENHDIRLAFEALKYLASLLCHKKFALEFLNRGGLQQILQIYRPSVAATGVSICLYYLAYSEDAMERICTLPKHVLSDMVSYALWLLECSHDSSRCHATMFFGLSFPFRVVLELFDAQDGLRKLMNVMFLLDIFANEETDEMTDDELLTKRQTVRHVCVALKRYFEAHLVIESEHLRRSTSMVTSSSCTTSFSQNRNCANAVNIPHYKAARYTAETITEYVENLLELMPLRINWKPVDEFIKLGGVKLLVSLIAVSFDWIYTGKAETVKCALDVLVVGSVAPKFQAMLLENIQVDEDNTAAAIRVILGAAEGDIVADPEVQKSALHVIINCVCGPVPRMNSVRLTASGVKGRKGFRSGDEILSKMWTSVRANNGIMNLLNLLSVKMPITDADAIRALACKALVGLARCDTVRQIIGKLPLFINGQLQILMKEPVLQDKRTEHVKFCKHCMELIVRVTGTPISASIDTSPDTINKAEVVAQTKIVFNEKELLQLIHEHLVKKGYDETASVLQREANLPTVPPRVLPTTWPSLTSLNTRPVRPIQTASHHPASSLISSQSLPTTPLPTSQPSSQNLFTAAMSPASSTPVLTNVASNSLTPITVRKFRSPSAKSFSSAAKQLQKPQMGSYQPSPVMKKLEAATSTTKSVTLDSIVTEYLRKQHALCKNPIVTCPPYDLFTPHRCPEPLNRNSAPVSMPRRLQQKQIFPSYGGLHGGNYDRKYVYSKFRPVKTYRDAEDTSSFTSCAFSYEDTFLFLGTVSGDLATFNLHTGVLEATYNCHESEITYIEPSRDGKSIITCSIWRTPVSALWSFTDLFEIKMSFDEDFYVEFGKQSQDKAIGTKYASAHLYDLVAEKMVSKFCDETISNKYYKNKATLNATDELVLNDGVLWDVRSSSVVHKFDKFNRNINGVFHPNGWEIIANSEVWDLRNFHLLKTVPALDQCRLKFNQTSDVIYGAMFEEETSEDESQHRSPFGSSFRTFDAHDYSNIATIDVKKNIFDLAVGPNDCYIAVVENLSTRDIVTSSESVCRLYEVGRSKEDDDEEPDEDDDEEDDDLGDDDSDDENMENTDDINPEDLDSNLSDGSGPISLSDEDSLSIGDSDSDDHSDLDDMFAAAVDDSD